MIRLAGAGAVCLWLTMIVAVLVDPYFDAQLNPQQDTALTSEVAR